MTTMNTKQELPILIVEDSDEDFDTALRALAGSGWKHEVNRASDGDECLELLRGNKTLPSFILLDLSMPGMGGRELLKELKSNPELRQVPIVIFSTSSNPKDWLYCYDTGASAYHYKPVNFLHHLELLRSIFNYWLKDVVLPGSQSC